MNVCVSQIGNGFGNDGLDFRISRQEGVKNYRMALYIVYLLGRRCRLQFRLQATPLPLNEGVFDNLWLHPQVRSPE